MYTSPMSLTQQLDSMRGRDPNTSIIAAIIDGSAKYDGEGLTPHERAQLHEVVMSERYSAGLLERFLKSKGYSVSESSIRRYRNSNGPV